MDIRQVELENLLYDADIDVPQQVRWDYSGRGMYDQTCFALVGDLDDLLRVVFAMGVHDGVADADEENSTDLRFGGEMLTGVRSDSMGHDTVYYWPNVTIVTGDGDSPTEED